MVDNKKTPEIRFDGFNIDWSTDVLGELTNVHDGTHQTPVYTESGIMFLSVENIKTLVSEKFISNEAFIRDFKIFPQEGDVLMTRIGDIGTANVIESNDPVAYYVSLALLKQKELDPYFLKSSIHSDSVKKDLWHRTLHIAFPKKINKNEIEKVLINYPLERDEQAIIGKFFRSIDDTMTLKRQQYEQTVNIKKSMLEKMFPKTGADVPEIRFDGFTEPWEIRKLGEISPLRGGFAFQSEKFCSSGIPIVKISNILPSGNVGGDFEYYQEQPEDEHYCLPNKAALLAMSGATTGKVSILNNPHNLKYYQNQRVGFFSDCKIADYGFISTLVRSNFFTYKLHSILLAGAQPNVSSKEIDALEFYFPTQVEEQAAIGNFFLTLDTLIEAQRQALEKLQNIKNACLNKMFV
ncbi:MAG: restriction endonuclease subunit S [Defluviitaleaceae bacterium]|nr:restriction endonuclease subunit S [Defluviitaleaceae bacterium]